MENDSYSLEIHPTLHLQYAPVSSFIYLLFEEAFVELYVNCIPDTI